MLDPEQFRDYIIKPSLTHIGLWSPAAEQLVLATAMAESNLRYLQQINGPALGLYQIEPITHRDMASLFTP